MISVQVWSDVACPWCYLGKKRLEEAIAAQDEPVEVTWRSFQLDPSIPKGQHTPHAVMLSKKFGVPAEQVAQMNQRLIDLGAQAGIEYNFDGYIQANTRDAHRLIKFAQSRGLGGAMKERLLQAQFVEGAIVDDAEVLASLAAEVGLDADAARAVIASNNYDDAVQADVDEAAALGARGVPFFVFEGKFAVSGAQQVETFAEALRRSAERD